MLVELLLNFQRARILPLSLSPYMLLICNRKLLTALLLLAFISQTLVAAAMMCQLATSSMPMSEMQHAPMAMDESMSMEHMHHNMGDMNKFSSTKTNYNVDCCKTMGHCLLGGCSLAATATHIAFLLLPLHATTADVYASVMPLPLISSLYRPPIFR
jgi:hypothetical protein